MPDPFAQAGYLPLPALSPYVRHDRFEQPKEVFKFIANTLASGEPRLTRRRGFRLHAQERWA